MLSGMAAAYVAGSAAVQAILDRNGGLANKIGGAVRDVESLRCSVASPDEDVIATVDGLQRVTALYLEPGAMSRCGADRLAELVTETVLAAGEVAAERVRGIRAGYFLPESAPVQSE